MRDLLGLLKHALADRYCVDCEIGWGGMALFFFVHHLKSDRLTVAPTGRCRIEPALGRSGIVSAASLPAVTVVISQERPRRRAAAE